MKTLPKFGRLLILALCCVLLLFITAELAHTHAAGTPDAAHCSLCLAAHTAMHTAITLSAALMLAMLGRIAVRETSPGIRFARTTQRIRPPPADFRAFDTFRM